MTAKLLQFAGSLAAVAMLVLVAWRLKLGGEARIADEAEARELADNALCGFAPEAIALDRAGRGALLRDVAGRIMLLAPHGNRFVGRLLDGRARSHAEGERLTVTVGEARLAPTTLEVADAAAWSRAIEALE
jgi:hypothetical protein